MINLLQFQSNTSEVTLLDRVDSVDSQDDSLGHSWNRNNSVSNTDGLSNDEAHVRI